MRNCLKYLVIGIGFWFLHSCEFSENGTSDFTGDTGQGGSLARFAVAGNNLYTVDESSLKMFDLSNPEKPLPKTEINLGFGAETIFPFENSLFLGTSTGMHIFNISEQGNPVHQSFFEHVYACDPVVTDGSFAYVTLSSSNQWCWRSTNELLVVDVADRSMPKMISNFPMENPQGLAIRNDTLWICDRNLKLFDVSNKQNIVHLQTFDIIAKDMILNKNVAIIIGEEGLTQYGIGGNQIEKLSEIRTSY